MLENLQGVKHRILVTGSRAKSSLVRLLHSVFVAHGFLTRSRITGVIPRELFPNGERVIERASPGHIREIEWWASQIDRDTQAIVAENSAVIPEFQPIAAQIIEPTMAVWTNCRPDHEDVWGPGREGACRALIQGIPNGIPVACGDDVDINVKTQLEMRGNEILTPIPLPAAYEVEKKLSGHVRENMELASAVCRALDFPLQTSLEAMVSLPIDIADFQIVKRGFRQLAVAFSANEPVSTARLFETTNWKPEETTLLYHHRSDRGSRLDAFLPWIKSLPWKRCIFTRNSGHHYFFKIPRVFNISAIDWNDEIQCAASFLKFWDGQVFGCGNVAGWPLDFLLSIQRNGE